MKPRILLAGGIIDFYVNKKKYNSLKTKRGKMNFVYASLLDILTSIRGIEIGDIEIRDASITSNNFWGCEYKEINDLKYKASNRLPKNEKEVAIRICFIDIIGIIKTESMTELDSFFELDCKNFYLSVSNTKIV